MYRASSCFGPYTPFSLATPFLFLCPFARFARLPKASRNTGIRNLEWPECCSYSVRSRILWFLFMLQLSLWSLPCYQKNQGRAATLLSSFGRRVLAFFVGGGVIKLYNAAFKVSISIKVERNTQTHTHIHYCVEEARSSSSSSIGDTKPSSSRKCLK